MRLLKVNKHTFGDWLQTPHPTKSTHEIILLVSPKVSITAMYVKPKHTLKYEYTPIPKGNVYKFTSIQKPPAS